MKLFCFPWRLALGPGATRMRVPPAGQKLHTRATIIPCIWMLLFLVRSPLTLAGEGSAPLTPDSSLQAAFEAVIDRGDLADLKGLEQDLGVKFYFPVLHRSEPQGFLHAIAIRSPPFLLGSWLAFDAVSNGHRYNIKLSFRPRAGCVNLSAVASKYHVGMRPSSPALDGLAYIAGTTLHNISVSITSIPPYPSCFVTLTQNTSERPVSMVQPPSIPAEPFAGQLAQLLGATDLRDFRQVARVLHARLVASTPDVQYRHGRLYKGELSLLSVLPGFDDGPSFYYSVDDSGWPKPPDVAGVFAPRHIGERMATLQFSIDIGRLCASLTMLQQNLAGIPADPKTDVSYKNGFGYVVNRENRNRLTAWLDHGCIGEVRLEQITDVAHALTAPVFFPLQGQGEESVNILEAASQARIGAILTHLRGVSLTRVRVTWSPGRRASSSQLRAVRQWAETIKEGLIEGGVPAYLVHIERTDDPYDRSIGVYVNPEID